MEEMKLLVDVFCPGTILGIVGNLNGSTVVLEYSAMDLCRSVDNRVSQLLHLLQNPHHRKCVLEGFRHAHILSFSGG